MRAFLATVLSVIAVGVLLIAYGLLTTRASATSSVIYDPQTGTYQLAQPIFASQPVAFPAGGAYPYARVPVGYGNPAGYTVPAGYNVPVGYNTLTTNDAAPIRTVQRFQAPRTTTTRIDRSSSRDWTKTALVIGGSTATGAGVGAIFGGKKGALIGAAIGGGASSLWESKH